MKRGLKDSIIRFENGMGKIVPSIASMKRGLKAIIGAMIQGCGRNYPSGELKE